VVNRVSTWLTISPPTIATPSGWRNSDPFPCQHQRQGAEQGGEGGHQDRPEAHMQAWWSASRGGLTSCVCIQGEIDHQDGVLS